MNAPYSQFYGTEQQMYVAQARIGTNHEKGDALRHWIHWAKSDNPSVLYAPVEGGRSEAEIDDHGEAYPHWHEGPDIWMLVDVPAGMQRMSLYFFNKDGHQDANRYRDYSVEVRECQSDTTRFRKERFWSPGWVPVGKQIEQASDYQIKLASKQPALATARARDFWGGVYKSFAICGGHSYWVKIAKNASLNAICPAIFFDRMKLPVKDNDGDWDTRFFTDMGDDFPPHPKISIQYLIEKDSKGRPMRRLEYGWLAEMKQNEPKTLSNPQVPLRLRLAMNLWKALDDASENPAVADLQRRYRLMAYRAVYRNDKDQPVTWNAGEAPKLRFDAYQALKNWRWHLGLWSEKASDDREVFRDSMAKAFARYQEENKRP